VKGRNKAFTVVELLTVITIIAILVGFLLPALTKVKTMVKETKQKAQLNTIGLAISGFKNDNGYYPPSDWYEEGDQEYSGSQMLTEALVGWDLMGFHPKSDWEADGETEDGQELYEIAINGTQDEQEENLRERKGPYLEDGSYEVYLVNDLFGDADGLYTSKDNYMLCDVFHDNQAIVASWGRKIKPGAPILYYRANTLSKKIDKVQWDESIYNFWDNITVIRAKRQNWKPDEIKAIINDPFPLEDEDFFYSKEYILDPKIQNKDWPYRPDSYLLISAGADGEYGTRDDITNFK
jgi:prepilin-type N-terminal cleavage/methylation domain-containing protein